jgi:prevent-host-death family protein
MPSVGIRELKDEASAIIRAVREEKAEYVVTYRGRPVAVIRPVEEPPTGADEILAAAVAVFAGLSPADVTELEEIFTRREDFFGETMREDNEPA